MEINLGNNILLDTFVILSEVKNLNAFALCIQILRDAQDDNLVLTDISFPNFNEKTPKIPPPLVELKSSNVVADYINRCIVHDFNRHSTRQL